MICMKKAYAALLALSAAACMTSCGPDVSPAESGTARETTSAAESAGAAETEQTQTSAEPDAAESTQAAETAAPEPAGNVLTDQDLEYCARQYYGRRTNYSPQFADVEHNDDGTAVIRLYDSFGDHDSTCDWYTVDVRTGKGTDVLGQEISLRDDSYEMWFPEDWCYNPDVYASVLYIGKMDSDTELNQSALQTLIDKTTGAREYVNHYPYVNEIPDHNMISTNGGEQVFMVIPHDREATLRICNVPSGEEDGTVLFRSFSGQPVIIRGNAAGRNDFTVTVTDQSGDLPYFSMWYSDSTNEIQYLGGDAVETLNFPFD